jgi:hypothetical protein
MMLILLPFGAPIRDECWRIMAISTLSTAILKSSGEVLLNSEDAKGILFPKLKFLFSSDLLTHHKLLGHRIFAEMNSQRMLRHSFHATPAAYLTITT